MLLACNVLCLHRLTNVTIKWFTINFRLKTLKFLELELDSIENIHVTHRCQRVIYRPIKMFIFCQKTVKGIPAPNLTYSR
jgi:hypothetical protein